MNLPLHLKYRPSTFAEVVGNDNTIESLISVLRKKGRSRCFLFHGESGCGKTTLARIVAKEVGCSDADFFEYNMANTRGIDTIRDVAWKCTYAPMDGDVKVYLFDECHRQTRDAQEALLKMLEDTPKHVCFILCTTDPGKLLKTIRTRCSSFRVSTLQRVKIANLLKSVLEKEKVAISTVVVREIAKVVEGCPRQALVLLGQVINMDEEEALQAITDSSIGLVVGEEGILDLCRALLEPSKRQWKKVSEILKKLDADAEGTRLAILGYLSKVLLSRGDGRVADLMLHFLDNFYDSGKAGLVFACYRACEE